jgi:hypothetical protein
MPSRKPAAGPATVVQSKVAASSYEYKTEFIFMPDASKVRSSGRGRDEVVRKWARDRRVIDGEGGQDWEPTEESIAESQMPAQHLMATRVDGVDGWITRMQYRRPLM